MSQPQELLHGIETPGRNDVLLGRGRNITNHIGNQFWRNIVHKNQKRYISSTGRVKKSIPLEIVQAVRSLNPPGRFLQKGAATGLWFDVGDERAREKTRQRLTDTDKDGMNRHHPEQCDSKEASIIDEDSMTIKYDNQNDILYIPHMDAFVNNERSQFLCRLIMERRPICLASETFEKTKLHMRTDIIQAIKSKSDVQFLIIENSTWKVWKPEDVNTTILRYMTSDVNVTLVTSELNFDPVVPDSEKYRVIGNNQNKREQYKNPLQLTTIEYNNSTIEGGMQQREEEEENKTICTFSCESTSKYSMMDVSDIFESMVLK